jgi:tRNA-modifying protein YgfZ
MLEKPVRSGIHMAGDHNRRMSNENVNPASLSGIAPLGYLGCIRVSGADAATFLHSQLTNDFTRLGETRARLAGFCSAKGRLQASFMAWQTSDADIILACSADLLQATLRRLSMFVLRLKCKLSDASAQLPLFGLSGTAADALLQDCTAWEKRETSEGTAIRLPAAAGHSLGLWSPRPDSAWQSAAAPGLSQEEWRWLQVQSGVPLVEAKTVDLFVPQMINFELLGGVDFQKGCYPGQEVVARSQYRGTLKRRMILCDCEGPASAGQEVYSPSDPGQPVGVVANAAARPGQNGSTMLVELKLAALHQGELQLGRIGGPPLSQRALPYVVPHLAPEGA